MGRTYGLRVSSLRQTVIDAGSSLRVRDFRQLWFAGLFSFMSVQMQLLLRGVLAWDLTEAEGALGLVYLVFGLSMLVATLSGGVAADRLPKRAVLLVSQTVLLVVALGMGIVVLADVVSFWMLLVASGSQGLAFGFYGPARVAYTAELVGADRIGNAITLSLLTLNTTRIFAPTSAGLLLSIPALGIGGTYLVTAAFAVGAWLFLLRLPSRPPASTSDRRPIAELVEGVRHVAAEPRLAAIIVASTVIIMFGFNYVAFIPALVEDTFGRDEAWVGYLMSASSLGALVVGLPLAARADAPGARRWMIGSGVAFGATVALLAFADSFWWAFAVVVLIGSATTGFQSLSNTLALGLTDDAHRGRVQSLMMLSFAGFGIAAYPLGLLAEAVGLSGSFLVMGVVTMAAAVLYAVVIRRIDRAGPVEMAPGAFGVDVERTRVRS